MIETITIEPIELEWSAWYPWERFLLDARTEPQALLVPDEPGVYEARYKDDKKRLTVGKASNLRMRVKQGLVKGQVPHSTGKRIRSAAATSQIVIRWATTDRPAAVEEELHRRHISEFGYLPTLTRRT
jgi:hypothetical protein